LGFSSSACTVWKKGAAPRDTAIQKMANYFHVTANYMLGNVNEPFLSKDEKGLLDINVYALAETKKPTPVSEDGLAEKLIERIVSLSHAEQEKVEAFLDGLDAKKEAR